MKRILAPFCLGILAYAQPNCALTSVRCVGSGQEYATIQSAANDAAPGDTVYVLDGTYAGFNLSPGHVSGTPAGPITFQAQSPATIINSPGDSLGDGIVVNLVDYVVIRGFTISGMTRAGVNIVESVGSVVQNTSITNSGSWGILTGFAYQVQILNNTITGVAVQHGIYVSNSNRSFDGPIVRGNMVSGAAENGIQFNGDCGTPDHTGGSDGVISGAIIEGNTVFGNGQHGLQLIDTSNSIVRNNLFYGNGNTTIQTGTQAGCNFGSNNDDIVNNTIDGGINFAGLRIVQPAMGDVIWNNLIISNDHRYCVDDVTGQQCPSDGTDGSYFSGNFSVSVASASTGLVTNYASHNYMLVAGSGAIGAATASFQGLHAPAVDLLGNTRPSGNGYDCGAYQYGTTSLGPDTTPPTSPGVPSANQTVSSVSLTWTAATDNREVMGYYIYRGGSLYDVALTNSYTDTNVTPGSTYVYAVGAYDDSGNVSSMSGSVSVTIPGTLGCLNSTTAFQSRILPTQTGAFTLQMDVTPFGAYATLNGVVGLAPALPTAYGSLAAIVAFSSAGIQARNGGVYTADHAMSWISGTSYQVRMVVNIPSHTYSVYVTPSGGTEIPLASNYAFRIEQSAATTINYLGIVNEVGVDAVCNVSLGGVRIDSMTLVPTITSNGTVGTVDITSLGGSGGGGSIQISQVVGLQDALNGKQSLLPYTPEQVLTFLLPLVRSGNTVSCPTCGTGSSTSFTAASPVITLQPQSQSVQSGANVTLTAAATGTPTPTVQWLSSPDGVTWTGCSGAIAASYTIIPQSTTHYRAVFTNIAGTAVTNSATITVVASATMPSNRTGLIAHTLSQNSNAANTTGAINTSGATLIVIAVEESNVTFNAPTDSAGNSWTLLGRAANYAWYYSLNPTTSVGHTFSIANDSGGSQGTAIAVEAFSGVTGLDKTSNSYATDGGNSQPGSLTPSGDGELLVSTLTSYFAQASTPAIDSGFTITDSGGSSYFFVALAYYVQSAAVAVNPTWSGISDYGAGSMTAIAAFRTQ